MYIAHPSTQLEKEVDKTINRILWNGRCQMRKENCSAQEQRRPKYPPTLNPLIGTKSMDLQKNVQASHPWPTVDNPSNPTIKNTTKHTLQNLPQTTLV